MLKTFTLNNGIKVATYSVVEMRSVYLRLSIKGGAYFDTPQTSGTAHFMEHILFEGTPTFPNVEALSDYVELLAGSFNASTSFDAIRFYINAPSAHLKDILKISSEVFFEPLFPREPIERERSAILEEIKQRQDNLSYKNWRFFVGIRFKANHPLLLDVGGSEEVVPKLQREDLTKYWQDFFYPKNSFLVLVGNFSDKNIKKEVNQVFGKFDSKKTFLGFKKVTNDDLSDKKVAIRFDNELKACYITLSFPAVTDTQSLKVRIAQNIIRLILGGLHSSRLYRLLRQRRGLVYDVGVTVSTFQHFGYVTIYSQVSMEKLEEVLNLIATEMTNFLATGPTKEELTLAKNFSKNRSLMQFDNPAVITEWIEGDLLWEDKIYMPESFGKIVESISKKDIIELMKKFWDLKKLNLVIQGPIEDSGQNIKKYSKTVERLWQG